MDYSFICTLICYSFKMATFDVTQFIDRPSVEGLEVCKKKGLYLIAQHYEILISKTQRKAEIKACVKSALLDKGVFSAIETLPTEAAESVVDASCVSCGLPCS